MKSRSGTFVLRLAAMAVLLEPVAAQGQGTSQKVCYLTADPITMKPATVCTEVSYPPPPAPPPEAPAVTRSPSSNSFVPYDPADEVRKAQLRATEHRNPSSTLCPPPYRMTATDGCQR